MSVILFRWIRRLWSCKEMGYGVLSDYSLSSLHSNHAAISANGLQSATHSSQGTQSTITYTGLPCSFDTPWFKFQYSLQLCTLKYPCLILNIPHASRDTRNIGLPCKAIPYSVCIRGISQNQAAAYPSLAFCRNVGWVGWHVGLAHHKWNFSSDVSWWDALIIIRIAIP